MPWSFRRQPSRAGSLIGFRNSPKYGIRKERKALVRALRAFYQAPSRDPAQTALLQLSCTWGEKSAIAVRSCDKRWEDLATMLIFASEVGRATYSTSLIDHHLRQLREAAKTLAAYSSPEGDRELLRRGRCAIVRRSAMLPQTGRLRLIGWRFARTAILLFDEPRLLHKILRTALAR